MVRIILGRVTLTSILFEGNNFNGNIYYSNVHDKMVEEILDHFQTGEHTGIEIVCGLISRPKYPHTPEEIFRKNIIRKQYNFVTYIDCQMLFSQ